MSIDQIVIIPKQKTNDHASVFRQVLSMVTIFCSSRKDRALRRNFVNRKMRISRKMRRLCASSSSAGYWGNSRMKISR